MTLLIAILAVIILMAIILIVVGFRSPSGEDPLQARLAEFAAREQPVTLEEVELSLPFSQRVLLPMLRRVGQFSAQITPQASLESMQHKLDMAGNPGNLGPTEFWAIRIVAAAVVGGLIFLMFTVAPVKQSMGRILLMTLGGAALGYAYPVLWLSSKIRRRKDEVLKALPDALDLLVICIEAGLGSDAAMSKVNEKWDNDLARMFGRAIQEIRLGKPRREALRDMAARIEVNELTSFVAAVVQAEQLGVSMGKILHIQSDQMRMRRRQRAEEIARQAPVKMMIPMVFLIFPALCVVLLAPAGMQLWKSNVFGTVF